MRQLELSYHRCFQIQRDKLDFLFGILTGCSDSGYIRFQVQNVFEAGDHYDVVVAVYGSYLYMEQKLDELIQEIKNDEKQKGST